MDAAVALTGVGTDAQREVLALSKVDVDKHILQHEVAIGAADVAGEGVFLALSQIVGIVFFHAKILHVVVGEEACRGEIVLFNP